MTWPLDFSQSLAAGFAILSLVTTLIAFRRQASRTSKAIRELEEVRFEALLSAPNLNALGKYLDNTLGPIEVSEYVKDGAISARVDRYVHALTSFTQLEWTPFEGGIGDFEIGFDAGEPERPLPTSERPAPPTTTFDAEPYRGIYSLIVRGDLWTALAKLRLYTEKNLRAQLVKVDPMYSSAVSAIQMTRHLVDHSVLSDADGNELMASLKTCNQAVHGDPVSVEHALAALSAVSRILVLSPPAQGSMQPAG